MHDAGQWSDPVSTCMLITNEQKMCPVQDGHDACLRYFVEKL